MEDKHNIWANGTGAISRPALGPQPRAFGSFFGSQGKKLAGIGIILGTVALCTVLFLTAIPEEWVWEILRVTSVGLVLFSLFLLPAYRSKAGFVIWWLVLISECIFFREGDEASVSKTFHGAFPTAAYGEVIMWVMCLVALLVCSTRVRGYVFELFHGNYKWMTYLTLISIASFVYAPRPLLSVVWGLKLGLIALLIVLCSTQVRNFEDVVSFLRYSFWAFVIIILQPIIVAMMSGAMFDEEGRMSTIVSPNALSPNAGAVLLMALALYSVRKGEGLRRSAIWVGLIAAPIMVLAGSKTGIMAAIISGGLFYLVCRKFGSAFGYIAMTGMLVAVLALTTPLGDYFHSYQEKESADSFSGRTILWSAVAPEIKARPIIGHGYMASEFLMFQVNAVGWAAPQMHNGFLESLYNNGLLGFIPMMAILIVIPVDLYRVLRRVPSTEYMYRIAAGTLSLYVFLLINGFFNSSFGGKPTAPFMLLLCLLLVSQKLRQFASPPPALPENLRLESIDPLYAHSVRT
jgi:O-antigen ligase